MGRLAEGEGARASPTYELPLVLLTLNLWVVKVQQQAQAVSWDIHSNMSQAAGPLKKSPGVRQLNC